MQRLLTIAAITGAVSSVSMPALAAEASFDLEAFTAIDISSGIDATVTVGDEQRVQATAPSQGELDELIVEVRGGTLIARVDWNLLDFIFGDRDIRLNITVLRLESAAASSGADVEVSGIAADSVALSASSGSDLNVRSAEGAEFKVDVSSGADLRIDGRCGSAGIDVSSGGTLSAGGLLCDAVTVEVSSGGDADVSASTRVTAEASSGGDIHVDGNPAERDVEERSGGEVAFSD